ECGTFGAGDAVRAAWKAGAAVVGWGVPDWTHAGPVPGAGERLRPDAGGAGQGEGEWRRGEAGEPVLRPQAARRLTITLPLPSRMRRRRWPTREGNGSVGWSGWVRSGSW